MDSLRIKKLMKHEFENLQFAENLFICKTIFTEPKNTRNGYEFSKSKDLQTKKKLKHKIESIEFVDVKMNRKKREAV